jgi:hypothetical protein
MRAAAAEAEALDSLRSSGVTDVHLRAYATLLAVAALAAIALSRPVAAQAALDVSVYQALLDRDYPNGLPSVIIVEATLTCMPAMTGLDRRWSSDIEEIPRELRNAAARTPCRTLQLEATGLPEQTSVTSRADVDALFEAGIEEGWTAFRSNYRTDRWYRWSHVLYANGQRDALVYSEYRCGGLCGEGAFVWLHRGSPQQPWAVRKRVLQWIS